MAKRALVAACVLSALGMAGGISSASATPMTCSPCDITVWELNPVPAGQNNMGAAVQQANTSNPLFTGSESATVSGTGTYTGALDLNETTTNTIGAFLTSDGGTTTGLSASLLGAELSAAGYGATTLFEFTGSSGATIAGTITHDDGITLYQGSTPFSTPITPASAAGPTSAEVTPFVLNSGAWQLLYTEANGLPATLDFETTPLPATWTHAPWWVRWAGLLCVSPQR